MTRSQGFRVNGNVERKSRTDMTLSELHSILNQDDILCCPHEHLPTFLLNVNYTGKINSMAVVTHLMSHSLHLRLYIACS